MQVLDCPKVRVRHDSRRRGENVEQMFEGV